MDTEIKIIIVIVGLLVGAPMLIAFLDWLIHGHETPEQKKERYKREAEEYTDYDSGWR